MPAKVFFDTNILASAERAGCQCVYSEDLSDGQAYGSLVVCNPFTKSPRRDAE